MWSIYLKVKLVQIDDTFAYNFYNEKSWIVKYVQSILKYERIEDNLLCYKTNKVCQAKRMLGRRKVSSSFSTHFAIMRTRRKKLLVKNLTQIKDGSTISFMTFACNRVVF